MRKLVFMIPLLFLLIFISGCAADRCEQIVDETKRTFCYQNLVKEVKDPSICEDKMPGVPERNGCYSNLATYHNDPDYCEEITGTSTRDDCYYEIAISTGDLSLCENMEREYNRNLCLNYVGD